MSTDTDPYREEIEMRPVDTMPGPATQEPQNDRPKWFQKWREAISDIIQRVDNGVSRSPVGHLFRLNGSGHVSGNDPGQPHLPIKEPLTRTLHNSPARLRMLVS